MIGFLLRPIVPVLFSTTAAIALAGVLVMIVCGDEILLFLLQLVVFVFASGVAFLLDDEFKSLTDVVLAPLFRRRAARLVFGFVVFAVGGAVLIGLLRLWAPSVLFAVLVWEIAGLASLAVAVFVVIVRWNGSESGNLVSSGGALVFVGVLILQPVLYVIWLVSSLEDPAHGGWWAAVMVAGVFMIFLLLGEWSIPRPCFVALSAVAER